jgi:hypothetical protein
MGRVSFRGRAGRSLVAPVVVAVALAIAAVPASAKPGGGGGGGNGRGGGVTAAAAPSGASASTTLIPSTWFPGAYCTFDVAYKWTGFKGTGMNVSVRLVDATGAPIANGPTYMNATGDGLAEFVINFTGSVGTPRDLYARGVLLANGVEVAGSAATSPALTSSTCGGGYGLRTFTFIDLT